MYFPSDYQMAMMDVNIIAASPGSLSSLFAWFKGSLDLFCIYHMNLLNIIIIIFMWITITATNHVML